MDLLKEILDVEQETAKRVDSERAKIASWLENTKRAIADATAAETARLEATTAEGEGKAKAAAAARAAASVERATSLASRLEALDADRLQPIVWRQLATILPGRDRDRADVEDRDPRSQESARAGAGDDSSGPS